MKGLFWEGNRMTDFRKSRNTQKEKTGAANDKKDRKRSGSFAEKRFSKGAAPFSNRTQRVEREIHTRNDGQKSGIVPRRVALDILLDVSKNNAYAQLALEKRLSQIQLERRDVALVTQLVYGTIEKRITLDYRINQFLKSEEPLDATIKEILRMGVYQLFYLDRIPDMAAVDESVTLTRTMGFEGMTGLVNAVLRNMLRQKDELKWPDPASDQIQYLSVMCSAPEALCRLLVSAYGFDRAKEILQYNKKDRFQSIRVNRLRCDDARLKHLLRDDGVEFVPGLIDGTYRVTRAGDLSKMRGYQNGLFCIQGESSVLAARAVDAKPGQSVLDACAAPGGKTAVLSEMMNDTGRVYAWDTHSHRVDLIRGMVNRLKLENVRPALRDARSARPEMNKTLDAALIDAPCSGTGVIYEKPDLKYRVTEQEIQELIAIQYQILEAVSPMVKTGGTLVYSTCSILPEENEKQIQAFLERHSDYKIESLDYLLPEQLKGKEGKYGLQLFTDRDDIDGFYIAKLRRVNE